MKALDDYFPMVVFTVLLDRVRDFVNFILIWTKKYGREKVKVQLLCEKHGPNLIFHCDKFYFIPACGRVSMVKTKQSKAYV